MSPSSNDAMPSCPIELGRLGNTPVVSKLPLYFPMVVPMDTSLLNQEDLQRWRACERRFWLHRRQAWTSAPDSYTADDANEADEISGAAAEPALRAAFPHASVIEVPDSPNAWASALARTQRWLTDMNEGRALFGACLADDGVQVRIDVLDADERGLRLFKLRYATVGDEADVDRLALWADVAARSGLPVHTVGLLLVDKDFVYAGDGCYAGLLREVDLTPMLGSRPVPEWLKQMPACERGPEPAKQPDAPCTQPRDCAYIEHCGVPGKTDAPATASLDIVGPELADELRDEGYADLLSVPEQRLPDARRRRAWRAIRQGAPELDPAVCAVMRAHGYPRRSLRFETIGFALPIWAGTRPYQALPFQWTCDEEPAAGQLLRHSFLATEQGDPRRAFAESLLQTLGDRGPIFAYNSGFERNRMRELALLFDDLAPALEGVQRRIVDLYPIARAHYYHPALCGSWSFKSLCRALAPDLQADCFECAGETSPQAAFALTQQEGEDAQTVASLRADLVAYGQRQTEVLRRMLALFEGAGDFAPAGTIHS